MAETTGEMEAMWRQYERTVTTGELRPYVLGEDLKAQRITINETDVANYGCPKEGDMIARDPKDRDNQWLVSKEYFEHTYKTTPMYTNPITREAIIPPGGDISNPTPEEQLVLDKRLGATQASHPTSLLGAKRTEF